MKKCELCKKAARMYCHSDRASLCWDCDSRVHAANFIVEKHTRTLLCHACQAPTPWTGSGLKLRPTVTLCMACCRNTKGNNEDEETGDCNNDEDDDGENQVVPWCLTPSMASSTTAESYSFSSSSFGFGHTGIQEPKGDKNSVQKQSRGNGDQEKWM